MKKQKTFLKILVWLFFSTLYTLSYTLLHAVNLTPQGISVVDMNGNQRISFSTGESIGLRQHVNNTVQSANMIQFKFYILNPSGSTVFTHTGNAAPGTPGMSQSQISGIAISKFYSSPGYYTFRGEAVLDSETVTQEIKFVISSPNIILTYPPDGARNLSDKPLIFRWVASGASKYKITVSDNMGFYNPILTNTNNGETFYSYPESPTEPRQQLVPGQIYYWKIEGLDAYNNNISQSNIYNFSIQSQATSRSRNIKVLELEITTPQPNLNKPINFKVVVQNTGNTNETNITVKFTLGGMPAQDTPKQIQFLNSGQQTEVPFTAFVPQGQEEALAVSCIDLFDDNIPDNCKTKLISFKTIEVPPVGRSTETRKFSYDEMWNEIKKRLGPDTVQALKGYTFDTISCANCTEDELNEIIFALVSGDAQITNVNITGIATDREIPTLEQTTAEQEETPEIEEPPKTLLDLELPPEKVETQDEWSGYTNAFSEDNAKTFVIRSKKEWKKIWNLITTGKAPDVDFDENMVVGIVAGKKDRAETVRILGQRKTKEGLVVDYYVIELPKEKKTFGFAYVFKVIPITDLNVDFKRLDIER